VQELRFDKTKVAEYRDAATKLHESLSAAEQRMDAAIENGDKAAAQAALDEATASGEAFRELRSKLKPTDLFVAKYKIQVHGPHEVSFVLPRGVSRYEMFREAQELVAERDKRDLVYPDRLQKWGNDARFTASCESPERIRIDGHFKGGDGKTLKQQERLLAGEGLEQAKLEDLAAAFVAHWVATGEPLFGWYENYPWSFVVRAVGGALGFDCSGLRVNRIGDGSSHSDVAVASRVRPPFAKASGDKPELKN
jgi:cell wall-associated NlpC family hydrolase